MDKLGPWCETGENGKGVRPLQRMVGEAPRRATHGSAAYPAISLLGVPPKEPKAGPRTTVCLLGNIIRNRQKVEVAQYPSQDEPADDRSTHPVEYDAAWKRRGVLPPAEVRVDPEDAPSDMSQTQRTNTVSPPLGGPMRRVAQLKGTERRMGVVSGGGVGERTANGGRVPVRGHKTVLGAVGGGASTRTLAPEHGEYT